MILYVQQGQVTSFAHVRQCHNHLGVPLNSQMDALVIYCCVMLYMYYIYIYIYIYIYVTICEV